ncbi:MAG: autotransporter outer membrane beta-barrel domain-containing protein [Phycisphaerales bacterium]|nr:MAG: autotransporter outer membrane beta-barrel domain-containing protein [Phycisphaerales bacterium]
MMSIPTGRSARLAAGILVGGCLLAGVFSAPAAAQDEERRIERAMRIADPTYRLRVDTSLGLTERSLLDVGGFASFSAVNIRDNTGNYRRLLQPEVTLYGRAVIDGAHTIFARSRFQYRDFSRGDSFDGRGDRWTKPFLDRYWYEYDHARAQAAYEGVAPENNFNIRVGRQFVDWNAGLALSETLYAARPTVQLGRFSIEGIAGVTTGDRAITDFDASRRDFNSETWRGFFGATFRYRFQDATQLYAYVLHMPDFNSGDTPRANLPINVDFDYEATYFGIGAQGSFTNNLAYLAEFVYQIGESQSDPLQGPQRSEDIRAYAARVMLTYYFGDRNNTQLEFETLLASGDSDRLTSSDTVGGNRPGTNDRGFNSLGFANTGLAFAPSLSNILTVRLGALTTPFPESRMFEQLQVGADVIVFNKLNSNAPIDEATSNDGYLGVETDFSVNYRITSDLAVTGRAGLFFPGDAITSGSHVRQFIFAGVTLSF